MPDRFGYIDFPDRVVKAGVDLGNLPGDRVSGVGLRDAGPCRPCDGKLGSDESGGVFGYRHISSLPACFRNRTIGRAGRGENLSPIAA